MQTESLSSFGTLTFVRRKSTEILQPSGWIDRFRSRFFSGISSRKNGSAKPYNLREVDEAVTGRRSRCCFHLERTGVVQLNMIRRSGENAGRLYVLWVARL